MYKLLAILSLCLVYACGQATSTETPATYQSSSLAIEEACNNVDVTSIPEKVIMEVPYVEQEVAYCGPASFSMVMGYYGQNVDQYSIGSDITTVEGAKLRDLVHKANELGFDVFTGTCQFNAMLGLVAEGTPVIARVLSKNGGNGHFIVVTGYDNSLGIVYVNDPAQPERLTLTFDEFQNIWNISTLGAENSNDLIIILSPMT